MSSALDEPQRTRTMKIEHVFMAVTALVLLVNAVLAAAGVITAATALVLFLGVEIPLTLVTAVLVGRQINRRRIAEAITMPQAIGAHFESTPVYGWVRAELALHRSVWLVLRGRRDGVGEGVTGFAYAKGTLVIPVSFGAVGLLEAIVVHILVPWEWLRIVLLILTIYSIVLLAGLAASRYTHPHLLSSSSLTLRYGTHRVAVVETADIARVQPSGRYNETYPVEKDGRLHLASADGTNVDIVLRSNAVAVLPGMTKRARRRCEISAISLFVDEPDALVRALSRDDATASGNR